MSRSNLNKKEIPYNPYCSVCSACGEDGCCSPLMCDQKPEGAYCAGYLIDLRFGYYMNSWFQNNLYEGLTEDQKKLYDEEWNKSFDDFYKK